MGNALRKDIVSLDGALIPFCVEAWIAASHADKDDNPYLVFHPLINRSFALAKITGYADSTGNAAMNTKLSGERAQAVVEYLFQQCSVPMRHIVAPGAMGEYGAAASNETKAGRAENRRVNVKILLNKGIAGS